MSYRIRCFLGVLPYSFPLRLSWHLNICPLILTRVVKERFQLSAATLQLSQKHPLNLSFFNEGSVNHTYVPESGKGLWIMKAMHSLSKSKGTIALTVHYAGLFLSLSHHFVQIQQWAAGLLTGLSHHALPPTLLAMG